MTNQELIETCVEMELTHGFSCRILDISENDKKDVENMILVSQKVHPTYEFEIENDYLKITKWDF